MKRNYTITLMTDGKIVIHRHRSSVPELRFLQDMVQGHIATVPACVPEAVLVVNDCGLNLGLPQNELATSLRSLWRSGFLVGNAVLLHRNGDQLVGWSNKAVNALLRGIETEEKCDRNAIEIGKENTVEKCDLTQNRHLTRCSAMELLEAMTETILTPEQAGRAMGISPQAIRIMARENRLPFPCMVVGRRAYIPRIPLIKYLKGEE